MILLIYMTPIVLIAAIYLSVVLRNKKARSFSISKNEANENVKDRLAENFCMTQEKFDLIYLQSGAKILEEKCFSEERKKATYDKNITDEIQTVPILDDELWNVPYILTKK